MEQEQQEKMKEAYMELQMFEQQIKAMKQQLESVDLQIGEVMQTKDALSELKKIKPGCAMKVPISNGIFVDGTITATDNLYVNVGSDVVVKKSVDATIEMMDEQIQEVAKVRTQLSDQLEHTKNHFKAKREHFKVMME